MTCSHKPLRALVLLTLAGLLAAGCGDPIVPPHDAGTDVAFTLPDGTVHCTTDSECDDHIACTHDSCQVAAMICSHTLDHAMCDDGTFCNGTELCVPEQGGCHSPSTHQSCDDMDVCTVDRCAEATKTCEHTPRDLDADGDVDFFCPGGTDCDDRDATRSGLAPEICDDMVDNDCDDMIDEGTPMDGGGADAGVPVDDAGRPLCGRPAHDSCSDPLEITSSGTTLLQVGGASSDYRLGCSGIMRPDLVARLTLTEPHDITITADSDLSTAGVALRTDCVDAATEIDCDDGFPGMIRHRALAAGTYFIIVQSTGEVQLDVQLTDPTTPPTNESCSSPILIPPTGGHYTGSFVDVTDDVSLSCNGIPTSDLVYQIDLPTESNLTVTLSSPDGQYMNWEVRPTCGSTVGSLRCTAGAPADGTLHQLPAGTYFILIEGPSYVEVDYTLNVVVGAPTPRVTGDLCTNPIELTIGTPYTGTMSGSEDDIVTSCGYNYRDLVHHFTLPATSDVGIDVDAGLQYVNASIRTTCDSAATQVRCPTGAPIASHSRALPAGDYYVVLEGARAGAYTITVTATTPPTVPMPATTNDNCGNPVLIPATGGYWTGDTTSMVDDYDPTLCGTGAPANDVAFRLDLAARSIVTATTEGSSFDTLLYRMTGTCRSGMETRCDDDGGGGGGSSQLSETLEPGTYFYIVDGFSTGYQGPYEFQVFISPAP